jgi:Ca2+-binding EF-hand superfamily protein
MDTSGDGHIGPDELVNGYNRILNKGPELDEQQAEEIISRIRCDENDKELAYPEFLIGCVDTSYDRFLDYCEKAYEKFFDNGQESIDSNELTGILC